MTGDKISEMVSGAILKTWPWIANIGALSPDVYSASRRMEFSAWFQTKVLCTMVETAAVTHATFSSNQNMLYVVLLYPYCSYEKCPSLAQGFKRLTRTGCFFKS